MQRKALAKKYHPDNTKLSHEEAAKKMAQINEAYDVLLDEEKRKKYIKELHSQDRETSKDNFNQKEYETESMKKRKKPFYKRIWFWLIVVLLWGFCGTDTETDNLSDSNVQNENDVVQDELNPEGQVKEEQTSGDNKDNVNNTDMTSVLDYLLQPAWNNISNAGIELLVFQERDVVFEYLSMDTIETMLENSYNVEAETAAIYENEGDPYPIRGTSMTVHYKKTLNNTSYYYCGEFDENNKATGLGAIFYFDEDDIYYMDEGKTPPILLLYVGYFKDGVYDGYGIEFDTYSYASFFDVDICDNNIDLLNGGQVHEGYFKYGMPHGQGYYYASDIKNKIWTLDLEIVDPSILSYGIKLGNFEYGYLTGECKVYERNTLVYEGEMLEDKCSGYGVLYDTYTGNIVYKGNLLNNAYEGEGELYSPDTGQLIYKGSFVNGQYHGMGILYDESGRVLHEGEFAYGDIK